MVDKVEVSVRVSDTFRGILSAADVIVPQAQYESLMAVEGGRPMTMFRVLAPAFRFECEFRGGALRLIRNGYVAEVASPTPTGEEIHILIAVRWAPESLSVSVSDATGIRENACRTPHTLPPEILKSWLRWRALTPTATYDSPLSVFESVVDQLQHLRDKINAVKAVDSFWNVAEDGRMIPKREIDIHPQISLLLVRLEHVKGLQVIPEHPAGSGRLDFLVCGQTSLGELVKVCVEFKLAHADDLTHGISVQLPEYMDRQATDFGIYCVLDFGPEYPHAAHSFRFSDVDPRSATLGALLSVATSHTGRKNIKPLVIDLAT